MKLLAIDLETTGLDPRRDQILQIGAVMFDSDDITTPIDELPYFETLVRHVTYRGDAFALQMNASILKRLADGEGKPLPQAIGQLRWFINSAGQNPHPIGFNVAAFDCAFLKTTLVDPLKIHHRPIELGSLFATKKGPVGSSQITKKILNREVTHDALQDARDAVELWRYWYTNQ